MAELLLDCRARCVASKVVGGALPMFLAPTRKLSAGFIRAAVALEIRAAAIPIGGRTSYISSGGLGSSNQLFWYVRVDRRWE